MTTTDNSRSIGDNPQPGDIVTGKDIRVKVIGTFASAEGRTVVFNVAFRRVPDGWHPFSNRQSASISFWKTFCDSCAILQ